MQLFDTNGSSVEDLATLIVVAAFWDVWQCHQSIVPYKMVKVKKKVFHRREVLAKNIVGNSFSFQLEKEQFWEKKTKNNNNISTWMEGKVGKLAAADEKNNIVT